MKIITKNDDLKTANDSFFRKLLFMTIVVFVVYVILSIIGFFLWFAFPVEKINGLTYLRGNNLIYYYLIVNFMDIAGVLYVSHTVYYKHIKTTSPVKDGVGLGLYLLIVSWLIDLFVYVTIRKTLPSIHEYFLGKNQPEIGIAWLIGIISAISSGWLHLEGNDFVRKLGGKKWSVTLLSLTVVSAVLTVVGILYFDIKP